MPLIPKQEPPYYENTNGFSTTIYKTLLTQTGTNAPTENLITNTTGATITWTRVNPGTYVGTASSNIFADATKIFISFNSYAGANYTEITAPNTLQIGTADPTTGTGTDDYLLKSGLLIEINVEKCKNKFAKLK